MIHPEHVETVAIKAYALFRAKYRKNPNWDALPEATRSKWRDLVIDADKVRNKVTEVFQEQCVFNAVTAYHLPVEEPKNVPIEAALADFEITAEFGPGALEPTPPPKDKTQPLKSKRK